MLADRAVSVLQVSFAFARLLLAADVDVVDRAIGLRQLEAPAGVGGDLQQVVGVDLLAVLAENLSNPQEQTGAPPSQLDEALRLLSRGGRVNIAGVGKPL